MVVQYQVPAAVDPEVGDAPSSASLPGSHGLGMTTRVDEGPVRGDSSAAPMAAPPGTGPVSVRTTAGVAVYDPAAVTPEDIVNIHGIETNVAVAMSMGYMVRNAAGHIVPASSEQLNETAQQQQRQDEADKTPKEERPRVSDEMEAELSDAYSRAPDESTGAAMAVIASDGEVSDRTVSQLASRLGVEPSEARAKVGRAMASYANEAATHSAKAAGISTAFAQEALQHARQNKTSEFRAAAEQHFRTGIPNYKDMVVDYIATLDQRDPGRILSAAPVAGRSVRYDPNTRQIIVTADGYEMTWDNAVRSRKISIG